MSEEQRRLERSFMIDHISDLLKDMKALDLISSARRLELREGEYIAAKENFNQTLKTHPVECKGMGLSYSYSQGVAEAKRSECQY